MKITVNNLQLELHEGARVKDAVLKYYSQSGKKSRVRNPVVEDRYGNQVAGDGELTDGSVLFIRKGRGKGVSFPGLVSLLLIAGLAYSCSTGRKAPAGRETGKQAVIFAVNDMHAAIDNFPRLAFIVDSLRGIYPDMLLVGAGDNQTGNPVNDQFPEKGLPMIELMNAAGFDLSAVGNHEFDSRQDGFSNLTHKARFSFICANLASDPALDILISPYKIITLPNALRLAFLGLLQINQNGIPDSHPDNVKGFTFSSPFETAREFMWLKDQCDIFIPLTHIGFENDVKLAETMPGGISLIIGGHSHTRIDKEQIHNGILITQAGSKLRYGTLIRLSLKSDGTLDRSMKLISVSGSGSEKPSVRAMVDKFSDNPVLNEVIATAEDDLSSHQELGYLMADAQRNAAKADISFVNPGGVRINHLAKGPITVMNVYQLDPFGNELVVTRLTGNEIRSLMFAAFPLDDNSPLWPSGIRTELTMDGKGNLKEVVLLTENGTPFDMNKTYTVAMNSYMTSVYRYDHADPGQSLFLTTAEATINYLKQSGSIRSYKGEKRVVVIR